MRTPLSVAVVGPQDEAALLAAAFGALPQAELRGVFCEHPRRGWRTLDGSDGTARSWFELLEDDQLDAVAFAAADLWALRQIAAALEADKHVYVETLVAQSSAEAYELFRLAEKRQRRLWALRPVLFGSGPLRLRALLDQGTLGEIFYVHGRRFVVPGGDDPSLVWGAGAELVAVVLDLLRDEPIEVAAGHASYLDGLRADVLFGELRFATGVAAHLHVSRIDAEVGERLTLVGSEFTAVLDENCRLALHASALSSRRDVLLQPGTVVHQPLPECDVRRDACADFLLSVHSPGTDRERRAAVVVEVAEALERACSSGLDRPGDGDVLPAEERNVIPLRGA